MARKNRKNSRAALKFFKKLRQRFRSNISFWRSQVEEVLGLGGGQNSATNKRGEFKKDEWSVQEDHFRRSRQALDWFKSTAPAQYLKSVGQSVQSIVGAANAGGTPAPQQNSNATYSAWDRTYHENFLRDTSAATLPEKKRQFSDLARNLGVYALRIGAQDPLLQAAAKAAAHGTNMPEAMLPESAVMNRMRQGLGINESGATRLNQFTGAIRSTWSKATGYATLGYLSNQGGGVGALASGQLVLNAASDAESAITSPIARELVPAISKKLLGSPEFGVKVLNMVGRMLRIGGAIGAVAQVGFAWWARTVETEKSSLEAQGVMRGQIRDTSMQGFARAQETELRRDYSVRNRSSLRRLTDVLGLTEGESEITRDVGTRIAFAEGMAANPHLAGMNAGVQLARIAGRLGVPVSELTRFERGRAFDGGIEAAIEKERRDPNIVALAKAEMGLFAEMSNYFTPFSYQASLLKSQKRLAIEKISGTGIFAGKGLGAVEQLKDREELYQKHLETIPAEVRNHIREETSRIGREAQAEAARRSYTD